MGGEASGTRGSALNAGNKVSISLIPVPGATVNSRVSSLPNLSLAPGAQAFTASRHGQARRNLSHAGRVKPADWRQPAARHRRGEDQVDPQLYARDATGDGRVDRLRAVEMVGEVSEIRRAERQGRGGRPVSFPRLACADPRHDFRGRVPGLPQEKPGEPSAAGKWLRQKRRSRL